MLRNYFKIAIAVLKRRKFFTFISLFGISFTLTILIAITAFVDSIVRAGYPEVNRDRSLYITSIKQHDEKGQNASMNPLSYYFVDRFVNSMKTPAKVAFSSLGSTVNTYVNNRKLSIAIKYTNEVFWEVMQFDFLQGKPYGPQQITNAERVAVISEQLKKDYFGDENNVTGKYLEADNVRYRIAGVVKSVPMTMMVSSADMYLPYTVSKTDYKSRSYAGGFTAVLLGNSAADLQKIQQEYSGVVARIPPEPGFDKVESHADRYLASFTRALLGTPNDTGVGSFITIVIIFVLLFMLLPTLNLVNINISRIMERSSEIGVRKAFGASSKTLVYQFIVENIILTFLGTISGILLSYIVLQVFNGSGMIANLHLSINPNVLLYSLIACLVFGLLSGVYPAWRMSKMHVVDALKAQ